MKIKRNKVRNLIRENIRRKLFESSELELAVFKAKLETMSKEQLADLDITKLETEEEINAYIEALDAKMAGTSPEPVPTEIASDFGGGEVGDDFILDDEDNNTFSGDVSRRNFLKGLGIGAAGAAAISTGAYSLSQSRGSSNPDMMFLENPAFDLSNSQDVQLLQQGLKGIVTKLPEGEKVFFEDFDKATLNSIFSGIKQCTPRQLIQIAMPVIGKLLIEKFNRLKGRLNDLEKMTLQHLYYEYYTRAANFVGITFAEVIFGLMYGHFDNIPFFPMNQRINSPDQAEAVYDSVLTRGYMDMTFVANGRHSLQAGDSFKDRVINGTNESVLDYLQGVFKSAAETSHTGLESDPEYRKVRDRLNVLYRERNQVHDQLTINPTTYRLDGSPADLKRYEVLSKEINQLYKFQLSIKEKYKTNLGFGTIHVEEYGRLWFQWDEKLSGDYGAGIGGVQELTGENPNRWKKKKHILVDKK